MAQFAYSARCTPYTSKTMSMPANACSIAQTRHFDSSTSERRNPQASIGLPQRLVGYGVVQLVSSAISLMQNVVGGCC